MKHRSLHLLGMIVFVLPLLLLPQRHTLAATLTASNALELVGAIAAANNTVGADTILLTNSITLYDPAVSNPTYGEIGLPVIDSLITIDGQGFTLERDPQAPNFRIFLVESGSLTLLNITLNNGNSGSVEAGTIYNLGTLNLMNTTISNGRSVGVGAAIVNNGTLNITNSTFSENQSSTSSGGAIYSDGTFTLTNSVFLFNSAGGGGGALMLAGGTTTISSSSFNYNNSAQDGGAVFVGQFSTLNVSGSTLFNNVTGGKGGGIQNLGTLNLTNTTLTSNGASNLGGGIHNGVDIFGSATIRNSTFVQNTAINGGGAIYVGGGSASVSNSVIRVSGMIGGACVGATGTNNLTDYPLIYVTCDGFTNSPVVDMNIGGLTNNGGSTSTNPINAATSSAVDVAATASCASAPVSGLDQRGVPRGIDGNGTPSANDCDIGAFEFGGLLRTLQFAAPTSSITPGGVTTMPVSVSLDAPLEAGYAPITAYIRVSGGTAVAGTNYAPFGVQTVTFNPGDQTKTVTLNLLNTLLTVDRTVMLSFANSSGPGFSGPAHLGTQLSHTVTLKASTANAAPVAYYYGTRDITLTWDDLSWATGYEIQVDSDSGFAVPRVYENTSLSAGTLSHEVTVPGNGTYYWRVRAKKADGTPAPTYSPTQSFVVAGT